MHTFLYLFAGFFCLTTALGLSMNVDAPWWYKAFISPWCWYLLIIFMLCEHWQIKIEGSFKYGKIRKVMMWFGAKPYVYDFNKWRL